MNHVQASYLGFPCYCDQIGQFSGKTNLSWWKSFLKADNILNALSQLEIDQNLPNLITLSTLEPFMVNPYGMSYTLFKANSNRYTYSLLAWNFGKTDFIKLLGGDLHTENFFYLKKYWELRLGWKIWASSSKGLLSIRCFILLPSWWKPYGTIANLM